MRTRHRMMSFAFAGLLSLSAFALPLQAKASEEGKKNTALALGIGAAALLLTQKNKLPGLITAGAAVVAFKSYDDDVKARHRRERDCVDYRVKEHCPPRRDHDWDRDRVRDRDRYREPDTYQNRWEGDTRYREEQRREHEEEEYRYHAALREKQRECEEKNERNLRNCPRPEYRRADVEYRTRDPRLGELYSQSSERLNRRRHHDNP